MRKLLISCMLLLSLAAYAAHIKTEGSEKDRTFFVQAGAFAIKSNADSLSETLTQQLHQQTEIEKQNELYLVKVGPFTQLAQAEHVKTALNHPKAATQQPSVDASEAIAPSKIDSFIQLAELPNTISQQVKVALAKANPSATKQPKDESTQQATNKPPVKQTRLWNLRNANIRSVIAEVSRQTGKNFVIDPRVQGKISIISSTPMSAKELYQVFLSMLQVSGYTAIPYGDVIKIVPNIDAKTQASTLLNRMKSPPKGDEMMVQVVPVNYVPSEQLVPVLRPLMPQWSNVSAYGPSNMLILSGRANNIKRLADIIRQVDSSSANGIDVVSLRYSLAMDVADTLKNLLQTKTGGISTRARPTVAADNQSNSVLISGTKTDRIRIRILVEKLDRKNARGMRSNTQVIYLHYQRAEDIVPILAGIAQANFSGSVGTVIGTTTRPPLDTSLPTTGISASDGGSSSGTNQTYTAQSNNPQATPNTQSSTSQTEGDNKPKVQLIAEPNTNSVIISAPLTLMRTLKTITRQLDIKPAQLLIEAIVAEINASDVNDLGIEWGTATLGNNNNNGITRSFNNGLAIINTQTSLSNFEAQIHALATQRKANILSTPSVVVLDNRQAKILVGKQVSVQASEQLSNVNATPFTTVDRKNVALHLYVRPQITRGNGIQMQIDQGNDTLDPPNVTDPGPNPVFNISSIVTSVHVKSGDIIVLGGLNQDSLANDDNRIPIVGDIPGIGRFFQRNRKLRDKRLLMVFIRPIILASDRDGLHVTGEKYDDIREFQLNFMRQQDYTKKNDRSLMESLDTVKLPQPFAPNVLTK